MRPNSKIKGGVGNGLTQSYIRDTEGWVLDHHNKMNIPIKRVK